MGEKGVILLSGGMDSASLLHYIYKRLDVTDIYALSFDYGQKHSCELEMARIQAESVGVREHRVIDVSYFREVTEGSALTDSTVSVPDLSDLSVQQRLQPPTYVPNRNMMLLSLAAAYAESRGIADVYYGAQAQDEYGYWDCTTDFIDKINDVLALNRGCKVTVNAPFVGLRKADVLKAGILLGVDFSKTWSCYRGGPVPCGTCPTCVERLNAFECVGIDDPLSAV